MHALRVLLRMLIRSLLILNRTQMTGTRHTAAPREGEGLVLDEVNYDEINDEVEAGMNESDDDGASRE